MPQLLFFPSSPRQRVAVRSQHRKNGNNGGGEQGTVKGGSPVERVLPAGDGQQTSGAGIPKERREGVEENVREYLGVGNTRREAC